jgi:hypothetical protein
VKALELISKAGSQGTGTQPHKTDGMFADFIRPLRELLALDD